MNQFDMLTHSEIVREFVREKKISVVGALYEIDSGQVKFLGSHPNQTSLLNAKTEEVKKGETESGGSIWVGLIIITAIQVVFLVVMYFLLIGEKRMIKVVRIRGRIISAFIAILLSVVVAVIGGMAIVDLPGSSDKTWSIFWIAMMSVVINLIFTLMYAAEIIVSIKKYISAIRQQNAQS